MTGVHPQKPETDLYGISHSYEKLYRICGWRAASRAYACPCPDLRRLPHPFFIINYLTKPRSSADSLEKHGVKKDVFDYLSNIYPKKATLSEIVDRTWHIQRSVIGVLTGYGKLYGREDSFVSTGLVACEGSSVNGKPIHIYVLTQRGLAIREYSLAQRNRAAFKKTSRDMVRNIKKRKQ